MSETAGVDQARANRRKTRVGTVVSNKMDKTVVVSVEDRVKHALYGKVMRRTSKLKAHDETNQCGVGDRVVIMETRPLSATKRWRVVEVAERAK
jgi:small subunit ribosomal protein S17